jgi:hypothetical protein
MKHPVGTRYSSSETYDQATDEVVHGFQVFEQCRPDGSLTGRKSFINNGGILCGIEIAEHERHQAILDSAHDLLDALKEVVRISDRDHAAWNRAKDVMTKAEGIS